MKVGYKRHSQVPRLDRGYPSHESSGLGTPHNTRPKIDKVGGIVYDDGCTRPRSFWARALPPWVRCSVLKMFTSVSRPGWARLTIVPVIRELTSLTMAARLSGEPVQGPASWEYER